VKVEEKASRQHKTPELSSMYQCMYYGDGLYHTGTSYNLFIVLQFLHAEYKWRKRRLKLNYQLQLYTISNSALNPLDDDTRVALVNV
jgi:hypothetical protein